MSSSRIYVQNVREKILNSEHLTSIYNDMNEGEKFLRVCIVAEFSILFFLL